jgi:hypothetical protein
VLGRAAARGELRADLDHRLATSVVLGPFFFRRLVAREPTTEAQIEAIVDTILAGIQAASASSPSHPA